MNDFINVCNLESEIMHLESELDDAQEAIGIPRTKVLASGELGKLIREKIQSLEDENRKLKDEAKPMEKWYYCSDCTEDSVHKFDGLLWRCPCGNPKSHSIANSSHKEIFSRFKAPR